MMNVEVRSANGITLVPLETKLLEHRKIFIEGEITEKVACEFAGKVMLLVNDDSEKSIDVLIHSHGGEISAGLMIYDIMQSCETPIRMYCLGKAYSMAAVLFASGRFGRYMLPNSEIMLHEPTLGNRVGGNSSTIKSISESLMETTQKINRILARHTGKTEREIEVTSAYDHYFSCEESIVFGLADKAVGIMEILNGNIIN